MNITNPIKPTDNNILVSDYELDKLVQHINQSISTRSWHDQYFPLKDDGGEWEAIILEYNISKHIIEKAVLLFKEAGWDCKFQRAYDARGPHQCFYVNKKHFLCPVTR